MRFLILILTLLVELTIANSDAQAAGTEFYEDCKLTQPVVGTFTTARATYNIKGSCVLYDKNGVANQTDWTAKAIYENNAYLEELDVYNTKGTQLGTLQTFNARACSGNDPWLTKYACNASPKVSGALELWSKIFFWHRVTGYTPGLTNVFSATFDYDRAPLVAKRDADLKAEAQRLRNSTLPMPVITPTIAAPLESALYLENTAVTIKVTAPKGLSVTSFLVKLERRDTKGNWGLVTNLPITTAQATNGYTGWGTPGSGKDPSRMVSLPGIYRVSAQVFAPVSSGWSQPVQFVVTTVNRAIQQAPALSKP